MSPRAPLRKRTTFHSHCRQREAPFIPFFPPLSPFLPFGAEESPLVPLLLCIISSLPLQAEGSRPWREDPGFRGYLENVDIDLQSPCEDRPYLDMDESYQIKVRGKSTWEFLRSVRDHPRHS